jgi:hypothetical protein
MRVLDSSSTLPFITQAQRGHCTVLLTRRGPSCTSARLSPSISIMQLAKVPMLYDSSSNQRLARRLPCLYICPVAYMLGCAPLVLCFIGGKSPHDSTEFPHSFKDYQRLGSSLADTQRDRGNSSRLYEVNIWMWCYGWGRPRMVSIAEAERIRR